MTVPISLTLFTLSVLLLGYIYAGYPILVRLLSRRFRTHVSKGPNDLRGSVVIVVHNEAGTIVEKVRNLLASDAAERLNEILIGSDGSTDATVSLLEAFPDPRVRVIPFGERRGKPAVLNDLIPQATGEVVILADARQQFAPNTVRELLENFSDPGVNVVSGELTFTATGTATTAADGIGFYWKYEKSIRKAESRFRGVPGATGACYAIRRAQFRPIPPETILDDVLIPLDVVSRGGSCRFESKAVAFDKPSSSTKQEGIRKRRTIAGNVQLVCLRPSLLLPWRNPLWFEFVSHKLLRLLSPALLVVALVTNLLLLSVPLFQVILACQVCLYLAALTGWVYQLRGRRSTCFGPFLMFLSLNWTTALALFDALRFRYRVTWQKAAGSPS